MKTILHIDDDQLHLDAVKEKLSASYTVLQAKSGHEGIELLKQSTVDLILLDLLMPGMDGQEFAYHLKELHKEDIPVIILSNTTNTAYPSFVKEYLVKSETTLDTLAERVAVNLT